MNRVFFTFALFLLNALPAFSASIQFVDEQSSLVKAIDADRYVVVYQWLKAKNSPEAMIKSKVKESIFDRAASHGSVNTCRALLQFYKYYKLESKFLDSRGTPLLVGLSSLALPGSPRERKYRIIISDLLFYYPETVKGKDHAYVGDGRTALHSAAVNGNVQLMKILIAHGADVDAKNTIGETPLHFSARFGHIEATKFLISSGANLNIQARHTQATPLMLAAERGHNSIIAALLARGADRNLKDTFGKTAIERSIEYRSNLVARNQPAVARANIARSLRKR